MKIQKQRRLTILSIGVKIILNLFLNIKTENLSNGINVNCFSAMVNELLAL